MFDLYKVLFALEKQRRNIRQKLGFHKIKKPRHWCKDEKLEEM